LTLPLSFPLSVVAFFAIFFFVRLIATRLPARIASYSVAGVVLALFYAGPRLFGRDWYDFGFGLGVMIGGFGWMAWTRMTGTEQKDVRSQTTQISLVIVMLLLIAFVVMLAIGR
jgi:hypothetical protein